MSLRGFHFVFITLSVILSLGFAYWNYAAFAQGHAMRDAVVAAISALVGVSLAAYGVWFLRKSNRVTQ